MKLLDIPSLSLLLNVKPKTIYDWVHRKYIPYIKLGKLLRFEETTILKWVDEKKTEKTNGHRFL